MSDSLQLVLSEPISNISLDQFKMLVTKWIECDNFLKRARELSKEKRKLKTELGNIIARYMVQYDIEDLNLKEGRIRCKTQKVKAPLNTKMVKNRIDEYFKNNEHQRNEIINKVFEEREEVQKVGLRRIRITNN